MERIPALTGAVRKDKKIEIGFCTKHKIIRLSNYYSGQENKFDSNDLSVGRYW